MKAAIVKKTHELDNLFIKECSLVHVTSWISMTLENIYL